MLEVDIAFKEGINSHKFKELLSCKGAENSLLGQEYFLIYNGLDEVGSSTTRFERDLHNDRIVYKVFTHSRVEFKQRVFDVNVSSTIHPVRAYTLEEKKVVSIVDKDGSGSNSTFIITFDFANESGYTISNEMKTNDVQTNYTESFFAQPNGFIGEGAERLVRRLISKHQLHTPLRFWTVTDQDGALKPMTIEFNQEGEIQRDSDILNLFGAAPTAAEVAEEKALEAQLDAIDLEERERRKYKVSHMTIARSTYPFVSGPPESGVKTYSSFHMAHSTINNLIFEETEEEVEEEGVDSGASSAEAKGVQPTPPVISLTRSSSVTFPPAEELAKKTQYFQHLTDSTTVRLNQMGEDAQKEVYLNAGTCLTSQGQSVFSFKIDPFAGRGRLTSTVPKVVLPNPPRPEQFDQQQVSMYRDKTKELRVQFAQQAQDTPQIRNVLNGFLAQVLVEKPDDVFAFAKKYYEAFLQPCESEHA